MIKKRLIISLVGEVDASTSEHLGEHIRLTVTPTCTTLVYFF